MARNPEDAGGGTESLGVLCVGGKGGVWGIYYPLNQAIIPTVTAYESGFEYVNHCNNSEKH